MRYGSSGRDTQSAQSGRGAGGSPMNMGILGLLAAKAVKQLTAGQPGAAPAPTPAPNPGNVTASLPGGGMGGGVGGGGLGGGLGGLLKGGLGGLLAGGAARSGIRRRPRDPL